MSSYCRRYYAIFLIPIFIALAATNALAHLKDQSYIYLRIYQQNIEGTVETTYKDLNAALGLNLQREMDLEDLQSYLPEIQAYLHDRISIRSDQGEHKMEFGSPRLMVAKMGVFLKSDFTLSNIDAIPSALDVTYDLIFDKDPNHTAYVVLGHHWQAGIIDNEGVPYAPFTPEVKSARVTLDPGSTAKGLWKMVKLGVLHFLTGLDHLFFLFALLICGLLLKSKKLDNQDLSPTESFFDNGFKLICQFTAGCFVTTVAVAQAGEFIPSRIYESLIALSIGLIALFFWPKRGDLKTLSGIAVIFGLIHGMGFGASLLSKKLNGEFMLPSAVGLVIGIALAQLLILVIAALIRKILAKRKLPQQLVRYAAFFFFAVAVYWFLERALDVDLLIDTYIGKAFGKFAGIFHHHH